MNPIHPNTILRSIEAWLFSACLLLCVGVCSCDWVSDRKANRDNSQVVAEVNGAVLTQNGLEDIRLNHLSKEDSLRVLKRYINRWIKDELMNQRAKKKLRDDQTIQRMVEEYEKSLLIHKYEQELLKTELDSAISEEQIAQQYKENTSSFILDQPIYRARWIVITNANISVEEIKQHWEEDKEFTDEKWGNLAELYASNYNLNPNLWWEENELFSLLPTDVKDKVTLKSPGMILRENFEEDGVLLLDYIERKEGGEVAPLRFVEDKIKKYILHQRKESFLQQYRERLYKEAVNNNIVKIKIQ